MRKVLFYTQDRWAFASIHHQLCKDLWKYGIYANLWNWRLESTHEEWRLLNDTYDLFVTNPEAVLNLHLNFAIPINKIAAVAHGQWDMLLAKQQNTGEEFYPYLYKFGVVSDILKQKAGEFGISVVPEVLTMGVNVELFKRVPATKLQNIGYAGARDQKNYAGVDIKRGHLVNQAVQGLPVNLVEHKFYNWMCMPAYYNKLDALVVSSIEESAGLPSMEAAAAGRLVMSTPVGYFEHHGPKGGGVTLPLKEEQFIPELQAAVTHFVESPEYFANKVKKCQEYALDNYRWEKHIVKWVDFLS